MRGRYWVYDEDLITTSVCVCVCVKKVSNRNNFRRTIVTQEGINIINIAQKLMT